MGGGIGGKKSGHNSWKPLSDFKKKILTAISEDIIKIKTYISNLLCTHVSGITFIRYAQYQNIGKPKVFGSNKSKGLNRIAKIG
jgi:hypothetical protein